MKHRAIARFLCFAAILLSVTGIHAQHAGLNALNSNTRTMFLNWMDANSRLWDPGAKLLRPSHFDPEYRKSSNNLEDWHYWEKCCYDVRGTSYYALGLLLRDSPGDRERAIDALNAVLANQYTQPGVRWYGTYKRTPEEYDPSEKSVMWRDYDPNWRDFIGTTLEIIVIEFSSKLPTDLVARLNASIDHAVAGEMAEGRLVPTYTNPSLMYGAILDFAASHHNHPEWQSKSAEWNENFFKLYSKYHAFTEFNSPTYDFVDLYGISLWRQYGSTDRMRSMGAEMEKGLWEEIGSLYQPDLHNISGPYDRSYSMDMENDAGNLFASMLMVLRAKDAPLASTVTLANCKISSFQAILGVKIPPDVISELRVFKGPHLVRKRIAEDRTATAYVGKDVIFGGESTNKTRDVRLATGSGATYHPASQFHPVTVQWRAPSGEIGWIRIAESPMIDATADEKGITISTSGGPLRFRMYAKDIVPENITKTLWNLPGLRVSVTSDEKGDAKVEKTNPANVDPAQRADIGYDVIYPTVSTMRLEIEPAKDK